jgi:hypothetical protein
MTELKYIKEFCKSLDIKNLQTISKKTQQFFIEKAILASFLENRTEHQKRICEIILEHYNIYAWKINKYKWMFPTDEIDPKLLFELPIKSIPSSEYPIYFKNRKGHVSSGHRTSHGLSGIDDTILVSAMQKYIRRNYTQKAIWCVLDRSFMQYDPGHGSIGKLTHIRNRLKIIFYEDIGIANLDLFIYLYEHLDCITNDSSDNCDTIEKTIVDVVSRMSQTKHTRMISFVKSIPQLQDNPSLREKVKPYLKYFPTINTALEYIKLNCHKTIELNLYETLKTSNIACFYYYTELNYPMKADKANGFHRDMTSNLKGKNYIETFNIFKKIFKEKALDLKYVIMTDKWYRSFSNGETYFTYFHLMIMLCFPCNQNGYLKNMVDYKSRWKDLVMYNIVEKQIDIDEYVVDMHTKIGKTIRKFEKTNLSGKTHFLYNGSYVENEYVANEMAQELKNFYEFRNLLDIGTIEKVYLNGNQQDIQKFRSKKTKDSSDFYEETDKEDELNSNEESDWLEFIGRAQATTSISKFDSYFARIRKNYKGFKKGEVVFVKGPLPKSEENVYDILLFFKIMKKIMGLPYIDVERLDIKMSEPSLFFHEIINDSIKKSNIRYAKKFNSTTDYMFLIYKNLCGDNIPTRLYGSNVDKGKEKSEAWINAKVTLVDFKKLFEIKVCKVFNSKEDLKDNHNLKYYILSMYFRYLFGIIDHADRNFLIEFTHKKFYSVDEENIYTDKEITFIDSVVNKSHRLIIRNNWTKVKNEVLEVLKLWKEKLPEIMKLIHDLPFKTKPLLEVKFIERFNKLIEDPEFIFENE